MAGHPLRLWVGLMDVGAAPLVDPSVGTGSDNLSQRVSNKSPEIVRGELVEP